MENGKYQWVNNLFVLFLILLSSCQSGRDEVDTLSVADSLQFENGDIICRQGNGFFSGYFKNTSKKEQIYSHVGIIVIHGDSVSVIHSEASELTGIGGVRQESLGVFLRDISTWAVYRVDTIQPVRDSIVAVAKDYLAKDIQFDLDFDLSDDKKVYCTQLLALSVNKAMQREVIHANGHMGKKVFYAIDDIYLIPEMKPILVRSKKD